MQTCLFLQGVSSRRGSLEPGVHGRLPQVRAAVVPTQHGLGRRTAVLSWPGFRFRSGCASKGMPEGFYVKSCESCGFAGPALVSMDSSFGSEPGL